MAVGRRRGEAVLAAGLVLLLGALRVPATCPGVSVSQQLLKEGFHRELVVKVELGARGEDAGGCTVAARIHLPPGIFVDPYELASLQQHNLTKAVLIPDTIDVEAPEYLSTELHVLLFLEPDLQCPHCFQAALPVHGRYHRPAEESQEAWVVVQSPEALLCCCDNLLPAECWTLSAAEGAPCSGQPPGPCRWYRVTQKPSPEELVLQVPVGLRHQSSLVCVLTLLATVLCSCLVLAAVCRHGHLPRPLL
ncbi:phosphatidylinositol-glycan biosynthesis class X protein [Heliangelus exortis]|uniref:phosphatidylinositol-glycan biosynthesis class X protein n=1 Tax=Heliangelus exortis TaxID=472823 RepID=UPI003A94CD30